ncbi:MAG: hypothetical protein AB7F86_11130 [Bdellovibrionales bacterium]
MFKVTSSVTDGALKLSLVGQLDEMAELPQIDLTSVDNILIEVDQVSLINSSGIRGWMMWAKSLKGPRITVERCTRIFVDQSNMIRTFIPEWFQVNCFDVPYFCENCGTSFHLTQPVPKNPTDWTPDETHTCIKCGAQADLDAIPERYVRFLADLCAREKVDE